MKTTRLMTLTVGLLCAGSVWAAPALQQIAPLARSYVDQTDFDVMLYSGVGDVTSSVSGVDLFSMTSGCDPADFAGFPAGNIALVKKSSCTFLVQANNALAAGATGVLIYSDVVGLLLGGNLTASFGGSIPVMGLTQALGLELAATPSRTMRMYVDERPLPSSVPEPGTLALLGLGLAGLVASRRRLQ
jgi:PA domain/PEP-CTERM motif